MQHYFSPATKSFQDEMDMTIEQLETRYNFKCECLNCSKEDSSQFEEGNAIDDPLWATAMEALEMTVNEFRSLPREAIKRYERKVIELVQKYKNIRPDRLAFMQESLMLIWTLLSQHF